MTAIATGQPTWDGAAYRTGRLDAGGDAQFLTRAEIVTCISRHQGYADAMAAALSQMDAEAAEMAATHTQGRS